MKRYNKPTTEIISGRIERILSASLGGGNNNTGKGTGHGGGSDFEGIDDLAKEEAITDFRYSVWDD